MTGHDPAQPGGPRSYEERSHILEDILDAHQLIRAGTQPPRSAQRGVVYDYLIIHPTQTPHTAEIVRDRIAWLGHYARAHPPGNTRWCVSVRRVPGTNSGCLIAEFTAHATQITGLQTTVTIITRPERPHP